MMIAPLGLFPQKRTCQRIKGQSDQGMYVLVESPQCWKERNGAPLKYEMCFPDPEDMKVKIVLRAASKGVNTVFIGYDSAHARPFLKLKELLAAEKHVSCNIQYIYTSCVDLSCVGSG